MIQSVHNNSGVEHPPQWSYLWYHLIFKCILPTTNLAPWKVLCARLILGRVTPISPKHGSKPIGSYTVQLQHSKVGIVFCYNVSSNSTPRTFLGGRGANTKMFLQSSEGFKINLSKLGHSPNFVPFLKKKRTPYRWFQKISFATANLHGASLPDYFLHHQNSDFLLTNSPNWILNLNNTSSFNWSWKNWFCCSRKHKKSKKFREVENLKVAMSRWRNSTHHRGSDIGLTFFAMCSAPCLPELKNGVCVCVCVCVCVSHYIHSSCYFLNSLADLFASVPNPNFAGCSSPLRLRQSSWKHHVEARGDVSTNGWPTSSPFPTVIWSLRDKNPKDSRHQKTKQKKPAIRSANQRKKGTLYPGNSFSLAAWNGSNRKQNQRRFLIMFIMNSGYLSKNNLSASRMTHVARASPHHELVNV